MFQVVFRHGFLYRESSHIPASPVSPLIRFFPNSTSLPMGLAHAPMDLPLPDLSCVVHIYLKYTHTYIYIYTRVCHVLTQCVHLPLWWATRQFFSRGKQTSCYHIIHWNHRAAIWPVFLGKTFHESTTRERERERVCNGLPSFPPGPPGDHQLARVNQPICAKRSFRTLFYRGEGGVILERSRGSD